MTKAELIATISAKKGFVRIVKDELAQDSIPTDNVEKRFFTVEHLNADGTGGIVAISYLHNTETDEAKFYNYEPVALDSREATPETKKLEALEAYLKGKYAAYFIKRDRIDFVHNWAEADVYALSAGKLLRKTVLVFKQGTNPISDLEVTTV